MTNLVVERDGPVTVITINRPERRNAVDSVTARELFDAFTEFDTDRDASVAILTGAGGYFCAGADLKALTEGDRRGPRLTGEGPMGATYLDLGKPVIAAIEGPAVAGGIELALWCDLRVAARDALLGVYCRRFGVPLIDGGTVRLPRLIGHSRAMDLILTGRGVDGEEAERIGLVNRVVEPGGALTAARELAHQLAALPQTCMRNDRRSAIEQWGMSEHQALLNEARIGRGDHRFGRDPRGRAALRCRRRPSRHIVRRRWLAAVIAIALVAGCSKSDRSDLSEPPPPTGALGDATTSPTNTTPAPTTTAPVTPVAWKGCGSYDCADYQVPLDHADPAKGMITLALRRQKAKENSRRIGSLFINPGGPGASGYDYLPDIIQRLSGQVTDRFDIVGFDPRGVGRSKPVVDCLPDSELETYIGIDPAPDDDGEERSLIDATRRFVDGCRQRTGDLLFHVSTADVAKDLDVLRAAVGDEKLTFYGASYGTAIGAMYAELFPTRIRALVLDGAVDPSLDNNANNRFQAIGFDRALDAFLDWCRAESQCQWRPSGGVGKPAFIALMNRIDGSPLPAGSRVLNPGDAFYGVAAPLYNRQAWPLLGTGLASAEEGKGSVLQQLADLLTGRERDGHYNNLTEVLPAVNCVDKPTNKDLAFYKGEAARIASEAPAFGAALGWAGLMCALWPAPVTGKAAPVNAPGSPPIVVIGTTGDPATPYEWSQALAKQLPQGRLVTHVGEGHTAYGEDSCVNNAADRYLIDLTEPAPGLRC